jgi:glycosyltransferase involved in cell wall biosynthesis
MAPAQSPQELRLAQQPLVSVVTPVYNGASYLRECIESVLRQSYTHWDYTIVNNCSSDGTLDIAREYAAKDSRIRIHNNETFVRVIENYNIAYRQISPQSKYVKLVAADDWLFPECLERMVRLAEAHPSVAIVGAYRLEGTKVTADGLPYPSTVLPGRAVCRTWLMGGAYVFGAATTIMFRADIVRSRHAFYNESNLHADGEVCLELLEHRDFGFEHQVLTFTRVQEGSLTSHSASFQTNMPRRLYDLLTYGPKYLTSDELQGKIAERFKEYYAYLGEQVYRRRGPEFWKFHRGKLAALGHPLSKIRLTGCAVNFILVDLLLHPGRLAQAALRRLRRRPARTDRSADSVDRSG